MARISEQGLRGASAMEAIFRFSAAMTGSDLSIADLIEVMTLAIADGHGILAIHLSMALCALECAEASSKTDVDAPPPRV